MRRMSCGGVLTCLGGRPGVGLGVAGVYALVLGLAFVGADVFVRGLAFPGQASQCKLGHWWGSVSLGVFVHCRDVCLGRYWVLPLRTSRGGVGVTWDGDGY